MEKHSRDRQSDSVAGAPGAADAGLTTQAADIFDEIAVNIFRKRDLPIDPKWSQLIAEEFRIAMADLDVQVKPKGPKPNFKRTTNGVLMLLIGALENGDIWVRDTLVPVNVHNGTATLASNIITFDCGELAIEAKFVIVPMAKVIVLQHIVAMTLPHGQRVTSEHSARAWLKAYLPTVDLDVFSPALQAALNKHPDLKAYRVTRADDEGRIVHWPDARTPQVWKDARGREL
jgi:hypothetical protein